MSSPFKQTKEYNCGPAAVAYFCDAVGIKLPYPNLLDVLETLLHTTPEDGTNHERIAAFLGDYETIRYGTLALHEVKLPMIASIQSEGDGHYVVVTDITLCATVGGKLVGEVWYFDPATGLVHREGWKKFVKNWHSNRYGEFWGLCLA